MGKKKSIGLPGGPNEFLQDITQYISVEGYKTYSTDKNNPVNIIESGSITMKDVDFPVYGIDNLGNEQMMLPENEYQFPGDVVMEIPQAQLGLPGGFRALEFMVGNSPLSRDIKKNASSINTLTQDEELDLTNKVDDGTDTNLNLAKLFAGKYMNSPRYKNMLSNSLALDELDYPARRIRNFNRLQDTELVDDDLVGKGIGGYSRSNTGEIFLNPNSLNQENIYDHEISHSIDRDMDLSLRGVGQQFADVFNISPAMWNRLVPKKDIDLMKSLQKKNTVISHKGGPNDEDTYWDMHPVQFWKRYGDSPDEGTVNYFTEPTEVRARLNELRRSLYDQGVDIFNNPVKQSDLQNIENQSTLFELEHFYGEDGVLKMINTISDASDEEEFKSMAQDGLELMSGGGSVSWKWKGKSYSGTLIPSMENEKNRYARTKNGKIKTLPKAQDGNFPSPNLDERKIIPKPTYELFQAAMDDTGLVRGTEEYEARKDLQYDKHRRQFNQRNLDAAVNFAADWMSSPKYKEMLINSGGTGFFSDSTDVAQARINNLNQLQKDVKYIEDDTIQSYTNEELSGVGGYSRSNTGEIFVKPHAGASDYSTIYDHEISHSIDRPEYDTLLDKFTDGLNDVFDTNIFGVRYKTRLIPSKDVDLIESFVDKDIPLEGSPVTFWKNYGDTPEEGTKNYFAEPTEVRARLNEIRRLLDKKGVDIFNNEITPDNYKSIQDEQPAEGLRSVFSEEAIIEMLNKISDIDMNQDSTLGLAKDGGNVPLIIGGYGLSKQQNGGSTDTDIKWQDIEINFDGIRKALKMVESADGTLMINEQPNSTATGYYGQKFSEIKDLYDGSRIDFSKDIDAQERFFKDRVYKGVKANNTTALLKDAFDLTNEYKDQLGDKWNFSYEDVISLSNFLGRGGTRKYFGDIIRDGKSLEEVFPKSYGPNKQVTNKTPEEYLAVTREFYQDGGENIYKVKRGDNLSRIARTYNTTVDDIVSINDIPNPSMINIDQEILLPEGAQAMSSNFYEVKEGDTLGKIAKRFNTSYKRLAEVNNIANPNFIRRGQSLKLPDEYREEIPLAEESWISVDTLQRNTDDINALADEDVVIKSQMINDPNQRYVVIDKKNQRLKLYHGDEVITDFEVATGKNSGDAQTVTYARDINGDGKITEADKVNGQYKVDWSKGNLSTGAGKYTMSTSSPTSRDYYNNAPSFNMVNEAGIEVSTAIHGAPDFRLKYFDNNDINDNRSSNGCINGKCSDLQGLYDMGLPAGTPIFILPEDEGNQFELVDGQAVLRMSRSNRENYQGYEREQGQSYDGQGGNYSTNTLRYKPIRAKFDEAAFRNEIFTAFDFNDEEELYNTTIPFINALVDNKKEIMQASKIPSDVYNQIAKIAFGIYGTESNYGDTHSAAGNFSRAVNKYFKPSQSSSPDVISKYNTYGADKDSNSVGYTQMRFSFLNDTEKAALKQFNITKNSDMLDPEKSAIATAVVLGVRYNEQLTKDQKKNPMLYLPTKWNNRSNYAKRVKNNSKFLNFEQFDRMRSGGEVEERIIYKNYMNGMYDNNKMTKNASEIYDKLNRKYLKQSRELGMSPANYIMTYVIGNS